MMSISRRSFLKRLSGIVAGVVAAPLVNAIKDQPEIVTPEEPTNDFYSDPNLDMPFSNIGDPKDVVKWDGHNLYVSGTFTAGGGIAKMSHWNGEAWDDKYYSAGSFGHLGENSCDHVAKWTREG